MEWLPVQLTCITLLLCLISWQLKAILNVKGSNE